MLLKQFHRRRQGGDGEVAVAGAEPFRFVGRQLCQFFQFGVDDAAAGAGGAHQAFIVQEYGYTVGGHLHVEFNIAGARGDGRVDTLQRVFRIAPGIAPVGDQLRYLHARSSPVKIGKKCNLIHAMLAMY